jgi:hypothetical protein
METRVKAYQLLGSDMWSDEHPCLENRLPWSVGEARTFVAFRCGNDECFMHHVNGYESSPTLWDALILGYGPIACVFEVSEPFEIKLDAKFGSSQISVTKKLLRAFDVSIELRTLACDCAERVLPIYEQAYPGDERPRRAIDVSRRLARGEAALEELDAAWNLAKIAADAADGLAFAAAKAAAFASHREITWGLQDAMCGVAVIAERGNRAAEECLWMHRRFEELFRHYFED